ncbi:MAG: dephospho-CoA kinase, partial [Comamonas sp.]
LQAEACGAQLLVFDVPLLVESGRWRQQLDGVLVVDCAEDTQISRVMARNQLERAAIERIMAAQATRAQRRAAADCVIYNEGLNLAALREQVLSISAWLTL